jgi:hypothetical protein
MPLSPDEQRCVLGACRLLARLRGGSWAIVEGATLDDLHPDSKSPEVLVSNGTLSAAIEVTELRGGSVWNEHGVSWRTLQSVLRPRREGHFLLVPSDDFRLPISKAVVRQLKQQIEVAAQSLHEEGAVAVVRVPRSAVVSLANPTLPGYVYCCHHSMPEVLHAASSQITGAYMLVDCDQWEHTFQTDIGRSLAAQRIANACNRRLAGEITTAEWDEEWALHLMDVNGSGVEILCATAAVSVPGMVAEDVSRAVAAKHRKFAGQQWADLHVLVMDARFSLTSTDYAALALSHVPDEQLSQLDVIALAHGDDTEMVWEKPSL